MNHMLLAIGMGLIALPVMAQDAPPDTAQLRSDAAALFEPIPQRVDAIRKSAVSPEGHKITPEKIELGRALFFDPRMSASGLISCQTCHNVGLGGADGLPTSIGHGWQKGPRNAPTVLNSIFNVAQFWMAAPPTWPSRPRGRCRRAWKCTTPPKTLSRR